MKLLSLDASGKSPFPDLHLIGEFNQRGAHWVGGAILARVWKTLTIKAYTTPGGMPGLPDFTSFIAFKLVSSRMRDLLNEHSCEVEFLPVNVLYQGKAASPPFYVANPLTVVKGLDLDRSEVELDEELGDVISAKRIVLNEQALEVFKWVKIAELQCIAVNEDFASVLKVSGLTGFTLQEASQYRVY